MTNKQLQEKLKEFPDDWPVVAQDGMDPSDWCEVDEVQVKQGIIKMKTVLVLAIHGGGYYLHEGYGR